MPMNLADKKSRLLWKRFSLKHVGLIHFSNGEIELSKIGQAIIYIMQFRGVYRDKVRLFTDEDSGGS